MAKDPRKRQKQQERRAAKRQAKHRQLARLKSAGLSERLTAAVRYPVLHSWVTTDLWTQGLGWVCLSRELPNGSVAYAVFLVDRYCLGVKNVMAGIAGRSTYDNQIVATMRREFSSRELTPAAVRKLVEGAVAYAHALGLPPHPDYQTARLLFGDIDPAESADAFEFGKDGKPLFISGPHDTPERCRLIMRALEQSRGADGFHSVLPMGEPKGVFPEALEGKGPRAIGPDETDTRANLPVDFPRG
jgi:hypothetical protein